MFWFFVFFFFLCSLLKYVCSYLTISLYVIGGCMCACMFWYKNYLFIYFGWIYSWMHKYFQIKTKKKMKKKSWENTENYAFLRTEQRKKEIVKHFSFPPSNSRYWKSKNFSILLARAGHTFSPSKNHSICSSGNIDSIVTHRVNCL